jgi:hypothetical protein
MIIQLKNSNQYQTLKFINTDHIILVKTRWEPVEGHKIEDYAYCAGAHILFSDGTWHTFSQDVWKNIDYYLNIKSLKNHKEYGVCEESNNGKI